MTVPDPIDLDDPRQIERADRHGLLMAVAYAGAAIRRTRLGAVEAGVPPLAAGTVRAIVIVTDALLSDQAAILAELLTRLAPTPVTVVAGLAEPHPWLSTADGVLVLSATGRDEPTVRAVEAARARGCETVVLAPADSPVARSARAARQVVIDWSVRDAAEALWPAIAVGLTICGLSEERIERLAADLDTQATLCGPAGPVATNPAKQAGAALATPGAVLVSCDPLTAAVCTTLSARLVTLAGILPGRCDLRTAAGGVERLILETAAVPPDIFHDPYLDPPTQSPGSRLRLVVAIDGPDEEADRRLREHADAAGVPLVALDPVGEQEPSRGAQLALLAQLAPAYAAIVAGST